MSDLEVGRIPREARVYRSGAVGASSEARSEPAGFQAARRRNEFIEGLKPADLAAVRAMLTPVGFKAGDILYPAGATVRELHLVSEGLVGLSVPFADGRSSTVALAGPEGIIGLGPALGGKPATESAKVIIAGRGFRLPAYGLKPLFTKHPEAGVLLARILARQITDLQVELACRTHHTVEQRLARLVLEACRKLGVNRLLVTQEELAVMLGVQRTTVSALAAKLKERGALAYLRGAIRIADEHRLGLAACDCTQDRADVDGRAPSAALAHPIR